MGLFKGINVVSISVPDLDAARVFYGETLGLGEPVYDLPEVDWIEFSAGADSGNIAVTTAADDWEPSHGTTLVLSVDDVAAAYQELRRLGVRCEEPEVYPGYVTICDFYDPFGNRLQVVSDAP